MWFVYSRFKLRKWRRYSSQKRLRVLNALEKKMAKKQHREPIRVIVHERSDWNCLGMFTASGDSDKKIYVHENLVINPSYRFHALETIIHEGRHATQFEIINKKLRWWQFRAKRWKKNFAGYISSSQDKVLYNNQAVERDAQKYTIKWLKKLAPKYKREKDFALTLKKNEYRYDNAEMQARKQYGMFYKFKMNKQIDNNMRD